jgi:hypothetical protein
MQYHVENWFQMKNKQSTKIEMQMGFTLNQFNCKFNGNVKLGQLWHSNTSVKGGI